jgi:hypothetical protein
MKKLPPSYEGRGVVPVTAPYALPPRTVILHGSWAGLGPFMSGVPKEQIDGPGLSSCSRPTPPWA